MLCLLLSWSKELPPTPPPELTSDLELENEMLRKEIVMLRMQVGQYRQTANSLRSVAMEVISRIQPFQSAIFQEETEK